MADKTIGCEGKSEAKRCLMESFREISGNLLLGMLMRFGFKYACFDRVIKKLWQSLKTGGVA